jgi:hypothetical protein
MSDLFDEKKKLKVFSLAGREIQHRVTLQPMSNVLGEIAAYDLSAQPVLPRYLSRHYRLSHFPLLAPPPKLSFLALIATSSTSQSHHATTLASSPAMSAVSETPTLQLSP